MLALKQEGTDLSGPKRSPFPHCDMGMTQQGQPQRIGSGKSQGIWLAWSLALQVAGPVSIRRAAATVALGHSPAAVGA